MSILATAVTRPRNERVAEPEMKSGRSSNTAAERGAVRRVLLPTGRRRVPGHAGLGRDRVDVVRWRGRGRRARWDACAGRDGRDRCRRRWRRRCDRGRSRNGGRLRRWRRRDVDRLGGRQRLRTKRRRRGWRGGGRDRGGLEGRNARSRGLRGSGERRGRDHADEQRHEKRDQHERRPAERGSDGRGPTGHPCHLTRHRPQRICQRENFLNRRARRLRPYRSGASSPGPRGTLRSPGSSCARGCSWSHRRP